jgi:hypothetical protein
MLSARVLANAANGTELSRIEADASAMQIKEDLMPRTLLYLAMGFVALSFVGCSGQTPPANIEGGDAAASTTAPGGTFNRDYPCTIRTEAEYYASGPQQGSPPDGTFAAGTAVKVLRETGGYWLVESEAGATGYVDSQAVSDPATEGALP